MRPKRDTPRPAQYIQHEHWSAARVQFAAVGRWTREMIKVDLDWWAEEVSRRAEGNLYARLMPSDAELGAEWGGVPRGTVQEAVRSWLATLPSDHAARWVRGGRAKKYHPDSREDQPDMVVIVDSSAAVGGDQTAPAPHQHPTSTPPADRSRVNASKETRPSIPPAPHQHPTSRSESPLSTVPAHARADSPRAFLTVPREEEEEENPPTPLRGPGAQDGPVLQALREREPHATTAGQEPDLPASDALLVVSWAAESPDADAVKLRDEHRAGLAPLRWSRAWIFGPQVAGDRLSRAKTWEAAGRPIAGEALLAPAAQAEADARFEPWTPPRGWRWGAACYAGVCGRVDTLEKAADGGAKTTHVRHGEVIRIFDLLKAAGWSGHHPRPVRVAARPDPAQVAAELWAAARSQGQAVAQTMTDPDARRDALDGLWGARVLGAAGDRVRVEVPACLDWGWLASAVAPELLAALDLVVAAGPPGEAPAPQPAQAEHPDPIVASVLAALKRRRAEDAGTSTDAEKAPAPSTPPAPAAAGPPPARERPATRTAGGPALRLPPPEPAAEFPPVVLPDGREIHGDLTALLGIKNAHLAQALVRAHIESTQDLLVLDEQERKHTPKVGPALWRKVAAALPEGVELGCLAGRARAGEGGSQQAAPRGGGRPDYAAQMAEIREMLQRDGGQNEHEHGVIEGDWTPAGDAGGGDGAGSDRFAARDAW